MNFDRKLFRDCPFVGLRPFGYDDRDAFFGRDDQIATLESMVARKRLISVIGSSGSGKSSLIRAGLLPRLASASSDPAEKWNWVTMRPGDTPVRALAEAMARPNEEIEGLPYDPVIEGRTDAIELKLRESSFGIKEAFPLINVQNEKIVLLIDQFEEIFRFADLRAQMTTDALRANEQRDEATFFIQLLLNACEDESFPGRIILTMRSDFIGECARFHGLTVAVTDTQYLVPALTRDQRAEVIRMPIERSRATIEPELVQRVLNDTNEDPDLLPVLQHAMLRTWQMSVMRDQEAVPAIRREDYEAAGGVGQAISLHANEILNALADEPPVSDLPYLDYRNVAKRVFQSLTETDALNRTIRRPQRLGELAAVLIPDGAASNVRRVAVRAVEDVTRRFADKSCSFLRVPEDQEIDETAVVDIGHEALIRCWDKLGAIGETNWVRLEQLDGDHFNTLLGLAREGVLLPPSRLPEMENWWADRRPNKFWAKRYNRDGAERLAEAESVLLLSRSEIKRAKQRKRRNVASIAAAAVFVLACIGAAVAYDQRQKAEAAQQRALDASKASAVFAAELGTSSLARDSASRGIELALNALEPAKRLPYVPELEGLIYSGLAQLRERSIIHTGDGAKAPPAVGFGTNGTLFVYADGLKSWNSDDGKPIQEANIWRGEITGNFSQLRVSRDGRNVLVWIYGDNSYHVIDTATGVETSLSDPSLKVGYGALSADSRFILTTSRDSSAMLWAEDSEHKYLRLIDLQTVEPHLRYATAVAFGDGFFAVGGGNGDLYLYQFDPEKPSSTSLIGTLLPSNSVQNVDGGAAPAPRDNCDTPRGAINALEINPANNNLLLAVMNGRPVLWDVAARTRKTLTGACEVLFFGGAFSPDGTLIASSSFSGQIFVWETNHLERAPIELQGIHTFASQPTFSHEKPYRVASGGFESRVKNTIAQPGGASPDSAGSVDRAAAAGPPGVVWTWNLASALDVSVEGGSAVGTTYPGSNAPMRYDTMTGHWLGDPRAFGDGRNVLIIPENEPGVHGEVPQFVAISPDGYVAWAPRKGRVLLFDLKHSNRPVAWFGKNESTWQSVAFKSGPDATAGEGRVAATSAAGETRAWLYFTDDKRLWDFAAKQLPFEAGVRMNPNQFCPDDVVGERLSDINPAIAASCTK